MSFKKFSAANDPATKADPVDTVKSAPVADHPPAPAEKTPTENKPATES